MNTDLFNSKTKEMDQKIACMVLKYQGGYGYENEVFVPEPQKIDDLLSYVEALRAEVKGPDFAPFWQQHFDSILRGFRYVINEHTLLPHNYVYPLSGFLERMVRETKDRPQEQIALIVERLASLDRTLTLVLERLKVLPDRRRDQFVTACGNIRNVMTQAAEYYKSRLADIPIADYGRLVDALAAASTQLKQAMAEASLLKPGGEIIAPTPFKTIMQDGMQVSMDSVLSWYKQDYEQRWEEFREAGRRIDPGRNSFDIIRQDARNYQSHAEQVADAKEIVQVIREAALRYVSLPEGEVCDMGAVPEQSKLFCPTAVYIGGNVWRKELWGMMGFNEDNYDALNRAELWGHITHECYPGHHTNYIKAAVADLPHTFLMRLPLTRTILEGVAHRSETLMMPHYENDVAILASHRRVLYCATRVKVEVDLNYYHRPAEEIIQMYLDEMRINEMSARLQTQAHVMNPGDAVSYYTGARILEQKRQDIGMSHEDFTELIFAFGFLPVSTMLAIIDLDPESQEQLKRFHA